MGEVHVCGHVVMGLPSEYELSRTDGLAYCHTGDYRAHIMGYYGQIVFSNLW